jgi:hypothetical protein
MRFSCLFFYLFLFSNAFGQDVETTKDEPVKSAVVLYMDEAPDVVRNMWL